MLTNDQIKKNKRRAYYHKNKAIISEHRKKRKERRFQNLCRDCPNSTRPGKVFCDTCIRGNISRKTKSLIRYRNFSMLNIDYSIKLRELITAK